MKKVLLQETLYLHKKLRFVVRAADMVHLVEAGVAQVERQMRRNHSIINTINGKGCIGCHKGHEGSAPLDAHAFFSHPPRTAYRCT